MLIVYKDVVININTVYSFWKSDFMEGCDLGLFYIMFTDTATISQDNQINFLPFNSQEERDKAFQDILFAYAEGKNVFAILTGKDSSETKSSNPILEETAKKYREDNGKK